MSARAFLVSVCVALAAPVSAQGFAGLGTSAEGFSMPTPGKRFSFPADHGAHNDFRIEWWYVTANLQAADGTRYGVQWTLFRSALAAGDTQGWANPQMWMGHAAITTPDRHQVAERFARGGIGQAGVTVAPFDAWIDAWRMTSRAAANADALSALDVKAEGVDFAFDLKLDADRPLVAHGDGGYSVKSAKGQASYYYSQPFYRVTGELQLPSGPVAVTGQAWLDREWSSQPLSAEQVGWDWFSLHFDSGEKLMAFRLRDDAAGFTSGTWISADGAAEPLLQGSVTVTSLSNAVVAKRSLPIRWRVEVPSKGVDITTQVLNEHAWMATAFPYWEGPISFVGTKPGRGYLEMTGYMPTADR